jgi:hypothetical protein
MHRPCINIVRGFGPVISGMDVPVLRSNDDVRENEVLCVLIDGKLLSQTTSYLLSTCNSESTSFNEVVLNIYNK